VTPRPKSSKPAAVRRTGVARTLSKLGIASRSIAARWVQEGRVAVNGRIVHDPESPVIAGRDRILVDGRPVRAAQTRYVMLNKPRGVVTTARDEGGRATVYDCFPEPLAQHLAPVGRLDKASEGLLLFSNDSEWASRLLDPAGHLPKVYHVQVDGHADPDQIERMRAGVRVKNGGMMRVSDVRILRSGQKTCWLEITLHEGRNRQIRRITEALGFKVLRLVRIAIGPLGLGRLAKGESRQLSASELRALEAALAGVNYK